MYTINDLDRVHDALHALYDIPDNGSDAAQQIQAAKRLLGKALTAGLDRLEAEAAR